MEIEIATLTNVSFLRARCPSIVAAGGGFGSNSKPTLRNVVLEEVEEENEPNDNAIEDPHDVYLKVYLRIKNVQYDKTLYILENQDTLICQEHTRVRNVPVQKAYKFSKVFEPCSTQVDVFEEVVKSKVLHFMNGFNCTLLTYGASGSGKTYTIIGTADQPGIIPRTLEFLFSSLPRLSKEPNSKPVHLGGIKMLSKDQQKYERQATKTILESFTSFNDHLQHLDIYSAMQKRLSSDERASITSDIADISLSIWITFVEIYNENIYDLLNFQTNKTTIRNKLQLGHAKDGNTIIKDVTYINVSCAMEAYQVLQYGIANLQRASTRINENSSRSHSIFSIKLLQHSNTKNGYALSSFNFCDLAGCERLKKTNNAGDRLKESNNINSSLLVLGRCISLVRENQKFRRTTLVPFRESKLTQIFQKALSGQEIISMIVNFNPITAMLSESLNVLNFSAIAKDVALQQQEVESHQCENRFTEYINTSNLNDSQEEDFDRLLMLQQEAEELENEISKQKIEAQRERERIISSYKALIKETEEFWQEKCRNAKNEIKLNTVKKPEVVVIDSSSDEEALDTSGIMSPVARENLKKQIDEVKKQLLSTTENVEKLKSMNVWHKETLQDATNLYSDLEFRYENKIKELCQLIVKQNDIIYEKTCQLNELESKKALKCENIWV